MPRKPAQTYDVRSAQTGAQVVVGVDLSLARSECARLCAEARMVVGQDAKGRTKYHGMQRGEVTTYDVVDPRSGLVVK